MKALIISAAAALALNMGIASAAPVGNGVGPDYAQNQQRLQVMPDYGRGMGGVRVGGGGHVGGGAYVGDGSDPGYYTPGFSGGTD